MYLMPMEFCSVQLMLLQFSFWKLAFSTSPEIFRKTVLYCDAHRECYTIGRSKGLIGYMLGEGLQKKMENGLTNGPMWINLHILLQKTGSNAKKKWIYGEKVTTSNGITVKEEKEKRHEEGDRIAVLTAKGKHRRVIGATSKYRFACNFRPDNRRDLIIYREEFLRDASRETNELFALSSSTAGCFHHVFNSTSIACGMTCYLNTVCRSFYHNFKENLCIHSLYVDSLLSGSDWRVEPEGWRRFWRPKWSLSKGGAK
ncbi:hypothetical protein D915_002236 [Fasciola hepatica]|uniref:Apple domain-containing protein n=1 Tax=Fasciola hepatica TaxID=6192 RepID=A0A4E0RE12_FASHE|nr:hypothetical protein D915_002236 [Fasciola hepatica]